MEKHSLKSLVELGFEEKNINTLKLVESVIKWKLLMGMLLAGSLSEEVVNSENLAKMFISLEERILKEGGKVIPMKSVSL